MNACAPQKSTASATHENRKREDVIVAKKKSWNGEEDLERRRGVPLSLFLSLTACFESF